MTPRPGRSSKRTLPHSFPAESDEILPYLASLIGLEVKGELGKNLKYLDGESMGKQIYLSSRRFFERLAQPVPLSSSSRTSTGRMSLPFSSSNTSSPSSTVSPSSSAG